MPGVVGLARGLWARLCGAVERTPAVRSNTQHLVQLSGYRWVVDTLGPLRGRRVLDVATGEGVGAAVLAGTGAAVAGVDLDARALARAARACPAGRFVRMDAAALAFCDGAFDVIVSQDTLEHVADDHAFVHEAHRVLTPDGGLVLFTPHAPAHTESPVNPWHVREYSADSLRALLEARFEVIGLHGRRPGARMRAVEARMDRARRWDPLGVRRLLVPVWLRHRLGSLVARRATGAPLEALTTADVDYFPGAEGSGTLIAVCRKRRAAVKD